MAAVPVSTPPTTGEVELFIKNWITEWEKTVLTNKIEPLTDFYSNSFRSAKGSNKDSWIIMRSRIAENTCYLKVTAEDIETKIEKGRAKVKYMQSYFSDSYSDKGYKKLTIVRESDGLKITYEGYEDRTPAAKLTTTKVKKTIIDWRNAWENVAINKKIGDLPSFYHPDFKGPGGKSKKAWMDLKMQVASKFTIIAVDVKGTRSTTLYDQSCACFKQSFRSDKYADVGKKVLVFKLKDGKPLIINELFHMDRKIETLKVDDFWGP